MLAQLTYTLRQKYLQAVTTSCLSLTCHFQDQKLSAPLQPSHQAPHLCLEKHRQDKWQLVYAISC